MAQGDVRFFDQFLVDVAEGVHDLETDDIRVALVTNTTPPTEATLDPHFGGTGTTNFATNEVTAGGNYTAGGAIPAAPSVTLNGTLADIDWGDVSWASDPGNPTDAAWAIIYNFTPASKKCIGYVDLGGVFDMTTGDLSITWATPVATVATP